MNEAARLLLPHLQKIFWDRVRDFDRDDLPPITKCPDCGYDGEGLEEQLAEIKRIMSKFDSGEIDDVDCLSGISDILEGAK